MIRLATQKDIKSLVRHLQNKKIDYCTITQMKKDVMNNDLYVMEKDNILIGMCSVVDTEFTWQGVKRLCIFNKKNGGKGYAQALLNAVTSNVGTYCVTPWESNHSMKHIAEKTGFRYQYTFNEVWCCYIKEVRG